MTSAEDHHERTGFVIMPFGGVWDDYYRHIYAVAIEQSGLVSIRADHALSAGSILQDIVSQISKASVVLVDLSIENSNVYYELGLSHALGKPTILVGPSGMDIPFDIGQERIIQYNKDNPHWGDELISRLSIAIEGTVRSPETAILTAFMHIKPARLEVDEVDLRLRKIEEMIVDLAKNTPQNDRWDTTRLKSNFSEKLKGLHQAEEVAATLLKRFKREDAIKELRYEGFPVAMAETAVDTILAQNKPK